ncbi:phage portal protein [Tanticharoenia sakaeratensis]|uniref:Phage portal protein n=1 Tax=Tanticharoenia sakaeratensis NBRC 103193 TaxID=1231623 RepID=A0A0D6MPG2_9PROT|nr:phage portal protein [Tanticharoenia sakaeratensis]GAN55584.1 phage portal protein [Tanticharoenia sakaeratensis NBRC 103193]GBQ21675.1 phage portal protein [Tanticharoenia sakaeratensis NBRC 103193]
MDWLSLRSRYAVPSGVSARGARLLALRKVLDGTQYDVLTNPFAKERSGAGEYIPLSNRRPSVRTNLCRTVVDESVSLLFGDTHWPAVLADDTDTVAALGAFVRSCRLGALMMEAAVRGSVGSVAILFEVACGVPKLSLLDTAYLTPHWDPLSGALLEVSERYAVQGRVLAAEGYVIPDELTAAQFWWQRTWTSEECRVMTPVPLSVAADEAAVDEERSVRHGLGFVPIVWIRNLGAEHSSEPDGDCTFERAIDTVIEADYLLSQAGRGLKYGSDPTLVLKTGGRAPEGPARQGGAASALTLPPEGDAKLLEINGNAAGAVLAHYKELRELVLEQLHGNRAHADRLAAAQSGRAMEMMCQPLIWLADRLRHAYGEGGLIPLFRMACRFSCVLKDGLLIDGVRVRNLVPTGLSLHWPPWFAVTNGELLSLAQGLVTAVSGGVLSRETAVRIYANATGNPDPAAEWQQLVAWVPEKSASMAHEEA